MFTNMSSLKFILNEIRLNLCVMIFASVSINTRPFLAYETFFLLSFPYMQLITSSSSLSFKKAYSISIQKNFQWFCMGWDISVAWLLLINLGYRSFFEVFNFSIWLLFGCIPFDSNQLLELLCILFFKCHSLSQQSPWVVLS